MCVCLCRLLFARSRSLQNVTACMLATTISFSPLRPLRHCPGATHGHTRSRSPTQAMTSTACPSIHTRVRGTTARSRSAQTSARLHAERGAARTAVPRERPQPGAPDAASHLPAPPTRPPPPHRSAPSRGRCGVRGGVLLAAACSVRAMGSRCLASLARAQSTQLIRARVRECGWRLAAQARARCLNSTPSRPRSRPQRAVYCKLVLPACLPSHRRGAAGVCGAAGRAHPPPRSHRSSRAQAPNGGGLAPALGGKVVSEVVRVGGVCVWGGASGRRTN